MEKIKNKDFNSEYLRQKYDIILMNGLNECSYKIIMRHKEIKNDFFLGYVEFSVSDDNKKIIISSKSEFYSLENYSINIVWNTVFRCGSTGWSKITEIKKVIRNVLFYFLDFKNKIIAEFLEKNTETHEEMEKIDKIIETRKQAEIKTKFHNFTENYGKYFMDNIFNERNQKILEFSKENNLILNQNIYWFTTPPKWFCPCCSRDKDEIVKITEDKKKILCCIVMHHCHSNSSKPRFNPTLLCNSCNFFEGLVKTNIELINPRFSFSPKEIREILSEENCLSFCLTDKKREKALDIYNKNLLNFKRMEKNGGYSNKHYYQLHDDKRIVDFWNRLVKECEVFKNIKSDIKTLENFLSELGVSNDVVKYMNDTHKINNLSYKKNSHKIIDYYNNFKPLTKGEKNKIKDFIENKNEFCEYSRNYNELDDNWSCYLCEQNKSHCIKVSKKGTLKFEVHNVQIGNKHDFVEEKICSICYKFPYYLNRYVKSNFPHAFEFHNEVNIYEDGYYNKFRFNIFGIPYPNRGIQYNHKNLESFLGNPYDCD